MGIVSDMWRKVTGVSKDFEALSPLMEMAVASRREKDFGILHKAMRSAIGGQVLVCKHLKAGDFRAAKRVLDKLEKRIIPVMRSKFDASEVAKIDQRVRKGVPKFISEVKDFVKDTKPITHKMEDIFGDLKSKKPKVVWEAKKDAKKIRNKVHDIVWDIPSKRARKKVGKPEVTKVKRGDEVFEFEWD